MVRQAAELEKAGDMPGALALARRALEESADTPALRAAVSSCLAYIHNHLGKFEEALRWADNAVEDAIGDAPARAEALLIRGICLSDLGRLDETEASLRESMTLARESGARRTLQRCLHILSSGVYILKGEFDLALASDRESLAMAEELGLDDQLWFPLVTMAWVFWTRGERKEAEEMLIRLREAIRPWTLGEGYYFCLAGDLAQESSTPDEAPEWYAKARSIADLIGDPGLGAELRVGLSRYHRRFGSTATALSWAEDALQTALRAQSSPTLGWALIEKARNLMDLGKLREADSCLDEAEAHSRRTGARFDLTRSLFLHAALHLEAGRDDAGRIWVEAVEQLRTGGYGFLLERDRDVIHPLISAFSTGGSEENQASQRMLEMLGRLPPPAIHIRCLGGFEVIRQHHLLPAGSLERRRAGELLRLLLISRNRSLDTDQALEALWPGKDPSRAGASLHQATSALRRALEPDLPEKSPSRYLKTQQGRMSLQLPPGSTVDFEEFQRLFKEKKYRDALDLYRGDLMTTADSGEDFIILRESLKQTAMQAAMKIASEKFSQKDYGKALEACLEALRLESWQEDAVLLGMKSLMAMHQRAGAIRLYQRLESTLKEELGVEPEPELREYYRSILSG